MPTAALDAPPIKSRLPDGELARLRTCSCWSISAAARKYMCRGSFPCCLEWSVTTYAVAAPCSNLLGDGTESKRSTAGPHQPELPREAVLIDEGLPAHGRHHVLAHKRERRLRDALVHRLQPIPLAHCGLRRHTCVPLALGPPRRARAGSPPARASRPPRATVEGKQPLRKGRLRQLLVRRRSSRSALS